MVSDYEVLQSKKVCGAPARRQLGHRSGDRELEQRTLAGRRAEIISLLGRLGTATAAELAGHLGISQQGIRQHLSLLQREALVQRSSDARGPGRPPAVYELNRERD